MRDSRNQSDVHLHHHARPKWQAFHSRFIREMPHSCPVPNAVRCRRMKKPDIKKKAKANLERTKLLNRESRRVQAGAESLLKQIKELQRKRKSN